jgi:hypothetical protein
LEYLSQPKWEDIIKMDFREILREGVAWIHLAQGRNQWRALVNTIFIKGGEFLDYLGDYQLVKKDSAPYYIACRFAKY